MRPIPCLLLSMSWILGLPGSAAPGPNQGGTLLVHADPALVVYTTDDAPYGGGSHLDRCDEATTQLPGGQVSIDPYVWWVSAAFADGRSPRLANVTFGVDYDRQGTLFVIDYGPSGDLELPTTGWPGSDEGTSVSFAAPRTDPIVEIYWFAGYEYYVYDSSFDLIPHPTRGANFADDAIPPNIDPIADLGRLGFNDNPGYAPCPASVLTGACCLPDGDCRVLPEDECAAESGRYEGDEVACEPNPCGVVPTVATSWGVIKGRYRVPR